MKIFNLSIKKMFMSAQKLAIPQRWRQFFPVFARYFPLVILGLIGANIILWATSRFNAGVTPDSIAYISTARNIAHGNGITYWDGSPLLYEPPLFPIVLAIIDLILGIDPLLSVRFVNAFLFGGIIFLSGALFIQHLKLSPYLAVFGTFLVLTSASLFKVASMAWTEPLFICFVLLYLIFSTIYIETKRTDSLVLLSLAIPLAFFTRYIGIILIPVGIISILLSRYEKPSTKIRHIFLFALLTVMPSLVLLARNLLLSGSALGYNPMRFALLLTPYQQMANTYHVSEGIFRHILSWYLPERLITFRPLLAIVCLVTGFVLASEVKGKWKELLRWVQNSPVIFFLIVYLSAVLIVCGPANILEARYLSPCYTPITLLALLLSGIFKRSFTHTSWKRAKILFVIMMFTILIYSALAMTRNMRAHLEKGSGYTGLAWQTSETMQYLKANRAFGSECEIYSNGNDVIFLLADLKTNRSPGFAKGGVGDISLLKGIWPQENTVCLVWFAHIKREYLFSPEELTSIAHLEVIHRFQDGTIYLVSSRH